MRQAFRRPAALVLGLVAAAGGLAACGAKSASPAGANGTNPTTAAVTSQCVPGPAITQTVSTPHYVMVLDAGSPEVMYTQAYVAAHHTTNGEVMISGHMTMVPGRSMGGMSMGPSSTGSGMAGMAGMAGMSGSSTGASAPAIPASSYRHLEIHICSRSTGKVLSGLNPTIDVVDNTAHDMSTLVPVSVMEGINQPLDLHYGNNVVMPPGRTFTVTVREGSDTATFHVSRPPT